MNMRIFAALVSCAATLAVLTGCSTQGDPHTVRLVTSLPRTGSARDQTTSIVNGVKMAIEEAGGKVGEFKIEFTDMDDATAQAGQWDATLESNNAKKAAQNPDVMVYIGPYNSGAAKQSMPILNRAGLAMISPANTSPELTKPGFSEQPDELKSFRPTGKINYFRVVPTDDLQGPYSADWAKDMGMKKIFIVDDKEIYGAGVAKLFEQRAKDIGLEILGHESIDVKMQEFRALMDKIKALQPDLIYFGGTTQTKGGQLVKDLVAAGLDCKFMAPDGCYEKSFITAAGAKNCEDRVLVTFGGMPPEQLEGDGAKFVESYKAKYKEDPEVYAVYGYECGRVAIEAIRRAGKKDRAAVIAALRGIKDFEGALGKWSFDENGDTSLKVMSGNKVKDGQFKFVKALGHGD